MDEKSAAISADAAYDPQTIRLYTRSRGFHSNIPRNPPRRNHPKRCRPLWSDRDLEQKRGAIERIFSWIEVIKKHVPRYERYALAFLGHIYLVCARMISRLRAYVTIKRVQAFLNVSCPLPNVYFLTLISYN